MSARLIDGTAVAERLRQEAARRVAAFTTLTGLAPGLATVLVGDNPASEVYVRRKRRAASEAGFIDFHHHLSASSSPGDVAAVLDDLAQDERVSGILLQLPLPAGFDRHGLVDHIPVAKDVDGLTTGSQGLLARGRPGLRPCTAAGVIDLLDETGINLEGAAAVIVGRSELVGHPAAELLLARNATVTIAHSRTRDLAEVTARADVLIAAAGIPRLITAAHIKPGAAVIDVGIHRTDTGLVGDVRFEEVAEVAGWVTPVPGGVGPMTIARLLANTIQAAEAAHARTVQPDAPSSGQ
ncbi:bifunctional 5,10-methylenetetrahydrofolate dehydrogenase/5,10-methenyltetrahydrofolate cyclohydrolase [Microbacterium sp. NPDC089696]|uniref:bifunctional 5,10-methylenetetrahydrofolate dehydrogenase/5,10-methenyltetrahydrofolate cyclohydrolase n=1 Tax=Microbacterium sp. NPDC089696 TaxID=3364199 RepID=UPI00380738EA